MDGTDFGYLAYLVVLLCGVAGIFFGTRQHDMAQMAKYALIWGGIFLALMAVVLLIQGLTG